MVPSITAVIVNVDGTLVDSINAQARAWRLAMSEFGIVPSQESIRRLIGLSPRDILQTAAGVDWYSAVGQALLRRRAEIFLSRFHRSIRAIPGGSATMRCLRNAGVMIAAVTVAPIEEAIDALQLAQCDDFADVVITGSDAKYPAGLIDVVTVALHKPEMDPETTVLVGSTACDLVTADELGIRFYGLRSEDEEYAGIDFAADIFGTHSGLITACLPTDHIHLNGFKAVA